MDYKKEYQRVTELLQSVCPHKDTIKDDCLHCGGTGEGGKPDSICCYCGGSGVNKKRDVCELCGKVIE